MVNPPFGFGTPGIGGTWHGQDAETLTRQYWTAWGEALRQAGGQQSAMPTGGAQGWHEAVDWWSKLAHGGKPEANHVVERFQTQARQWYGQMQQVAAQFAGQQSNPAEVVDAWKKALGAASENPFPEVFRAMRGQGQQETEHWIENASPYLDAVRREGMSWLSMPAFGIGREHQERMQAIARAQMEYQEKNNAYNALMAVASRRAFELFERKLTEHGRSEQPLSSARALFDLWIDASEEAYAEIALSQDFRTAYGEVVNAQMRLRNGIQKEVEAACTLFGMPTRSEVDASHRKVAELERQLRRLRIPTAITSSAAPQSNEQAESRLTMKRVATKKKPVTIKRPGTVSELPKKSVTQPVVSSAKKAPSKKGAAGTSRAITPSIKKSAPLMALGNIALPVAPSKLEIDAVSGAKSSRK